MGLGRSVSSSTASRQRSEHVAIEPYLSLVEQNYIEEKIKNDFKTKADE